MDLLYIYQKEYLTRSGNITYHKVNILIKFLTSNSDFLS